MNNSLKLRTETPTEYQYLVQNVKEIQEINELDNEEKDIRFELICNGYNFQVRMKSLFRV